MDLQPQHRTFSEFRDYMLQQARQRADVYVGDVCHPTKKKGTVAPRVGTNTGTPTATKATTPGPNGCVSDKLERVEARNRRT